MSKIKLMLKKIIKEEIEKLNESRSALEVSDLEQKIWASKNHKAIEEWDSEAEDFLNQYSAKYWSKVDQTQLGYIIQVAHDIIEKYNIK